MPRTRHPLARLLTRAAARTGVALAATTPAATAVPAQPPVPGAFVSIYQYQSAGAPATRSCAGGDARGFAIVSDPLSASGAVTCTFDGTTTASGAASAVRGGTLRARTAVAGPFTPGERLTADALGGYVERVTITGPVAPATVVFTGAIHGTGVGITGGPGWTNDVAPIAGRLEFGVWRPDAGGAPATFVPFADLVHSGDGTTRHGEWAVSWNEFATDGGLVFKTILVALGRPSAGNAGADVQLAADFSQSAALGPVRILDAAGRDVTARMTVQFAAAPEPGAAMLVGTGLVGLLVVRRRARAA